MRLPPLQPGPSGATKTRSVFLVFIGVAGLLLKNSYVGPQMEFVQSYIGNVTVSFSVYFIMVNVAGRWRHGRLLSALLALAAVNLFEALDGFRIMMNVYDPYDYLANTIGVGMALALDTLLDFWQEARTRARANTR